MKINLKTTDNINTLQISDVQYDDETIIIPQFFQMLEITENNGTMENIGTLNISVGTSRWNASKLEIEISNMTFTNETKIIEDNPTDDHEISKFLDYAYYALAVELNLNATTIIYGIYIYGENFSRDAHDKEIRFQVQGYNEIDGSPNGDIKRDIPLNMSISNGLGWHFQKFNTALKLSKGKYSIVINGTDIGNDPKPQFKWSVDDINPNHPDLNISFYKTSWSIGYDKTPFLYKLKQKVNETFYPSQINMRAEINGTDYQLSNKTEIGTGNLSLSLNNLFLNSTNWVIPIKNNISDALIFNVSYYIKLDHMLSSSGSVYIDITQYNTTWTVNPVLDRFGYNYTIVYDYPDHWVDVQVYRNNSDIPLSSGVDDDNNFLYIYNDSILYDVPWEIKAKSLRYNLTINTEGKTSYNIDENLGFFVENRPIDGNYSFFLVDTIGSVVHTDLEEEPTNDFEFNYTIPSNARNGEWMAYVFWTNGTDAGMQNQTFQITGGIIADPNPSIPLLPLDTTPAGIDPLVLTIIFITIGAAIGVTVVSYIVVNNIKKSRKEYKKKQLTKAFDVFNLQDVIVIAKESGLNVYEEHYSGKVIDATLVSGFLEAIRSFGLELTGTREQTQIISLEYKTSIVIMSEYKSFRLILVMSEKPSKAFLNSINNLSQDIEEDFGERIKEFAHDIKAFKGIHDLIQKHLNTAFVSPLQIVKGKDVTLDSTEQDILKQAKRFMKENSLDYFFTSFLFSEEDIEPKEVEAIFNLIGRGILNPIKLESKKK